MQGLKIAAFAILTALLLRGQPSVLTQLFEADLPLFGSVNAVVTDSSGYIFAAGGASFNTFVVR
jgi:hypothetical protein